MLQMLSGLLDYGEVQDGRFRLKTEPFSMTALAEAVRDALRAEGAGAATVAVLPDVPERVGGDLDRLRQSSFTSRSTCSRAATRGRPS